MALFAYSPRLVDDYDFLPFGDELARPFFDSRDLGALRSASNLAQQLQALRDSQSEVQNTDKEFRIRLDLKNDYKDNEVKITTNDRQICVHAEHEERPDKNCIVSRKTIRKYTLPPDVDAQAVTCTMNKDGVLHLRAPKKALEGPKEVPIAVEYKG